MTPVWLVLSVVPGLFFEPSIFDDGMILQRGVARVWGGGAAPGSQVRVSFGTVAVATAAVNSSGAWKRGFRFGSNVNSYPTYTEYSIIISYRYEDPIEVQVR